MNNYYSDKLGNILLDSKIGSGGEGDVYTIKGNKNFIAKIYKKSDVNYEKLLYMTTLYNSEIAKVCAWPYSVIKQNNNFCGFIMPFFSNRKLIYNYINPSLRKEKCPAITWKNLIRIAYNTCVAFSIIHKNGNVVGDINDSNVLVADDGQVSLIDCDSFQIKTNCRTYRCLVGMPEYTPPELLNIKKFELTDRTQNNDLFGLSVLIFKLLFMGRHPYDGVPSFDDSKIPYLNHLFAYSNKMSKRFDYKQPPNSLSFSIVSAPIKLAFESAFLNNENRCTALQWGSLLKEFESQLTKCNSNNSHYYYGNLSSCPWCEFEEKKGIIYFQNKNLFHFNIFKNINANSEIQTIINAIKNQYNEISKNLPKQLSTNFQPNINVSLNDTPLPYGIKLKRNWLEKILNFNNERRLKQEVMRREEQLGKVKTVYSKKLSEWEKYQLAVDVYNKFNSFQCLMNKINNLSQYRKSLIENKFAEIKNNQLKSHMEKFIINKKEHIKGVGDVRQKTLIRLGILSAWDIKQKLKRRQYVKGLNFTVIDELVNWSIRCENKFSYRNLNLSFQDLKDIEKKVREYVVEIRKEFESECNKLIELIKINQTMRLRLTREMNEIFLEKCQAEKDYNYIASAI